MVLTNAELFEILNAEIDRVNEACGVNKAHREDWEIKALNTLLKMSTNSDTAKAEGEIEILKELRAEYNRVDEATTVNEQHKKDLGLKIHNALRNMREYPTRKDQASSSQSMLPDDKEKKI